jgi:hypothetical protein
MSRAYHYVMENTPQLWILKNNQRDPLECILLHNTFPSATVFSFDIFTFLMFRKLNKSHLTKIKQQNVIGIRAFDSRLYLDISSSFKCPKCSPVVCLICYYLGSVR